MNTTEIYISQFGIFPVATRSSTCIIKLTVARIYVTVVRSRQSCGQLLIFPEFSENVGKISSNNKFSRKNLQPLLCLFSPTTSSHNSSVGRCCFFSTFCRNKCY